MYDEHPEQTIEDFDVFEILGRGGFAKVYRARSKLTGQDVAIKIIDKKMAQENKMTDRVRKEVELHIRLKHPSILELYGCFEDSRYVYIVLELCQKGDLYRNVQEHGPLSEDKVRRYMRQIVSGIKYLHTYNILHRDLTLANLLMTHDEKVKIGDFGLATELDNGRDHFTMCGTPNYIPPEVVGGRNKQGLAADIWSLGCIFYTMLVGRAPFDARKQKGTVTSGGGVAANSAGGGEVRETLTRVQQGHFQIPSNLSTNAASLIKMILQTHPEQRPSLNDIALHPFMQHSHSKTTSLHHSSHSTSFDKVFTSDSGIGSMNSQDSKRSLKEKNIQQNVSEEKHEQFGTQCNIVKSQSLSFKNDEKGDRCGSYGLFEQQTLKLQEQEQQQQQQQSCFLSQKSNRSCTKKINNENEPVALELTETLNSSRLRPIRQITKSVVLNIMEDQTVCLEFFRPVSSSSCSTQQQSYTIYQVMCIDKNGVNILIYNPNTVSTDLSADKPVPMRTGDKVSHFKLSELPSKYFKKYEIARKFINLTRSRTAKLTLYTNCAKCMIMENEPNPDFELIVLSTDTSSSNSNVNSDNGIVKIHYFGDGGRFECFYRNGTIFSVESNYNQSSLSCDLYSWLQYSVKFRQYCLSIIEKLVSENKSYGDLDKENIFPITIGRRLLQQRCTSLFNGLVCRDDLPKSILEKLESDGGSSHMSSTGLTVNGDQNITVERSQSITCFRSLLNVAIFIPDIGWATRSATGELRVNFNDGCQLEISYDRSEIRRIKWAPPSGSATEAGVNFVEYFPHQDVMPQQLHQKLTLLPDIVRYLRTQNVSQHSFNRSNSSNTI